MSICILPWIHLETTPQGTVRPCCQYNEEIPNSDLNQTTLEEIWTGDYMQELREKFLRGERPVECSQCWRAEDANNKSKRQQDNQRFIEHQDRIHQQLKKPVYLDLKLGTVCNIKCRTCSTMSSSKWAEDEKLLYGNPFNPKKSYWVDEESNFWINLEQMLDDVEYIDFTGGEPFLIKRHVQVLRKCVEQGLASNISIHYNTNGTIMPTNEMFDLWKQFKWVEIMFSIDGLNNQFEYIRHPAKWNDVESVFNTVKSKNFLHTSICHTVSIFNIYYLPEFINWFDKQGLQEHQLFLNLLYKPTYQCIQNLSQKQKTQISKKLSVNNSKINAIANFMNNTGTDSSKKLLEMILKVDQIRNENFKNTFPELYEILK